MISNFDQTLGKLCLQFYSSLVPFGFDARIPLVLNKSNKPHFLGVSDSRFEILFCQYDCAFLNRILNDYYPDI
jgi:hypothetical protein